MRPQLSLTTVPPAGLHLGIVGGDVLEYVRHDSIRVAEVEATLRGEAGAFTDDHEGIAVLVLHRNLEGVLFGRIDQNYTHCFPFLGCSDRTYRRMYPRLVYYTILLMLC